MNSLHWRHNDHDCVSNHQPHGCLLNLLFRRRSKKTSKLRVTGICEGNSPVTDEFLAQRASDAENVSIWWRHHGPHLCPRPSWSLFILFWGIFVIQWMINIFHHCGMFIEGILYSKYLSVKVLTIVLCSISDRICRHRSSKGRSTQRRVWINLLCCVFCNLYPRIPVWKQSWIVSLDCFKSKYRTGLCVNKYRTVFGNRKSD